MPISVKNENRKDQLHSFQNGPPFFLMASELSTYFVLSSLIATNHHLNKTDHQIFRTDNFLSILRNSYHPIQILPNLNAGFFPCHCPFKIDPKEMKMIT